METVKYEKDFTEMISSKIFCCERMDVNEMQREESNQHVVMEEEYYIECYSIKIYARRGKNIWECEGNLYIFI